MCAGLAVGRQRGLFLPLGRARSHASCSSQGLHVWCFPRTPWPPGRCLLGCATFAFARRYKTEVQKLSPLLPGGQKPRGSVSPSGGCHYGWPECFHRFFPPGCQHVRDAQAAFQEAAVSWGILLPCWRADWVAAALLELPGAEDAARDWPVGWRLWP